MYVTTETILTASAVLGALGGFVTLAWKLFKWINHQKEQDAQITVMEAEHKKEIAELKADFTKQIQELKSTHTKDAHDIQEEQTLVIYGLLACLKGLKEQGCNGPVTEAINKIDKYINQKAHEM